VPTVAEAGFEGYGLDGGWNLFAPARTPEAAVVQLAKWMTTALQSPEIKQKLTPLGFYPSVLCGTEFAAYFRDRVDEYDRSVREAKMKPE
jgi:tripartite-type tricarboxylate transporter receptor subunit TctC